jgi:2-polyprenyl-3-methyl-5-hydroxy-6-metoxy-1,4-benzoquinol methylase
MAQFHFVEDYEKLVANLIEKYPIDEAMCIAVGSSSYHEYREIGATEAEILRYAGLKDGMSLVDLGCGSGRLASELGRSMNIEFTGIDIVPAPCRDLHLSRRHKAHTEGGWEAGLLILGI